MRIGTWKLLLRVRLSHLRDAKIRIHSWFEGIVLIVAQKVLSYVLADHVRSSSGAERQHSSAVCLAGVLASMRSEYGTVVGLDVDIWYNLNRSSRWVLRYAF